jgi:hypothetical protein
MLVENVTHPQLCKLHFYVLAYHFFIVNYILGPAWS